MWSFPILRLSGLCRRRDDRALLRAVLQTFFFISRALRAASINGLVCTRPRYPSCHLVRSSLLLSSVVPKASLLGVFRFSISGIWIVDGPAWTSVVPGNSPFCWQDSICGSCVWHCMSSPTGACCSSRLRSNEFVTRRAAASLFKLSRSLVLVPIDGPYKHAGIIFVPTCSPLWTVYCEIWMHPSVRKKRAGVLGLSPCRNVL